jgi:hypothetical protein
MLKSQTMYVPPKPGGRGDVLMATYDTIRGEILARVPGIDAAAIPGLLQMLVSTACAPHQRDTAQVTHELAGLEMLWVEEIADLREAIAAQEQKGLSSGLNKIAAEAAVIASLRQEFMYGASPRPTR